MAIIDGVSVSGTVYGLRDNDTSGGIAPTFSTSTAYTADQYVWYDSGSGAKLYRFTVDHAAGAWTGTDATEVKLGNDVSALKSAIDFDFSLIAKSPSTEDYETGRFATTNGTSASSRMASVISRARLFFASCFISSSSRPQPPEADVSGFSWYSRFLPFRRVFSCLCC